MPTLGKKLSLLFPLILLVAFGLFHSSAGALPKDKKADGGIKPLPLPKANQARFTPSGYDEDEFLTPRLSTPASRISTTSAFRYLGPVRAEQAAVPYVDVRVGTPQYVGLNHMRRQVALSASGVVHMVYQVYNADSGGIVSSSDSAINFTNFYNAYDCGNSNVLRNGSLDLQMAAPGPPADPRPRVMAVGGIFIPPGTTLPVVYGNRFILKTETPQADDRIARSTAIMRDGAECLGLFSMDTNMNNVPNYRFPAAFALNESVWVATYTNLSGGPEEIKFNYTTDRGQSWWTPIDAPTYSNLSNAVEIAGHGNNFYIVSHADPADPTATLTNRPCYLKGTYNPATGTVTFGFINDITGNFELPGYLANMAGISALMVGDTLHVLWTDWNNYNGNGFAGPGGHVHHAAVLPDGTVQGPHKVADINIDGRRPQRSTTLLPNMFGVWPNVSLTHNPATGILYALWSAPPDDGNFGWGDYEATGKLACYDIFCSASPNNGSGWDEAINITQTNNPGCDGSWANPCAHEDNFHTALTANDTIWVAALVQRYPGFRDPRPNFTGYSDIGPSTLHYDIFRLYKAPARAPVLSLRANLGAPPGDTIKYYQISLRPRGGVFTTNIQLSNIGLRGFLLDSVTLEPGLNDGFLVTTHSASAGQVIDVGGGYDFRLSFNTDGVGSANMGARSGLLRAYVHSLSPPQSAVVPLNITAYVVPTLCLNHKIRIHSGSNQTDIGSQGSIKDQGGDGMNYLFDGSDRFYDGGVWIANSALNAPPCATGPRKVTRQIFYDQFLRCLSDGVLDSTAGTGYYNLSLVSVATDVDDSVIVYQNIWEQSTHPDSSDFLIQTTRVINIGTNPIDSVAMGVLYDVDVAGPGVSDAGENVSGDTVVSHLGRTFWLGWLAGNDVYTDSCFRNRQMYGFVVIPGSIGDSGDFVRPRGAVIYNQNAFSYHINCTDPSGGDTLAQRYSWNLDVLTSARDRTHDSLTLPANQRFCPSGAPIRADMGYMTIAKKVYNFPVNGGGQNIVARYGLDGLAASVDTFFSGPGRTYTVIHVGSIGGLASLIANAVKGIDWYVNHANLPVGPRQTRLKGDLNNSGNLTAADVVSEMNYVYLGIDVTGGAVIPICVADLNNTGDLTAADMVILLNITFLGTGCPNCLRPCI